MEYCSIKVISNTLFSLDYYLNVKSHFLLLPMISKRIHHRKCCFISHLNKHIKCLDSYVIHVIYFGGMGYYGGKALTLIVSALC